MYEKAALKWSQPQLAFLSATEYEVLYGGAAFGGKSLCLTIDPLRQVDHPKYRAMIFRREYSELEELIGYARDYYGLLGGVEKNQGRDWEFPSGAKIQFRMMEHQEDWRKYTGRNTTYLGFDELCTFTKEQYESLMIWNRASAEGLKCYVRATTNPWPDVRGDSLDWIMDRWRIPRGLPVRSAISFDVPVELPDGETYIIKRSFIPATYRDNIIGKQNNPQYLAQLQQIPDKEKKKAFMDGIWGVSQGAFFSYFSDDHILSFDEIQERIKKEGSISRACGMDYGGNAPTCVLWGARTYENNVYVEREHYEGDKPIEWHAPQIRSKTPPDQWPPYIVADPSMWFVKTKYVEFSDRSPADEFIDRGIIVSKANNDRLAGFQAIREGFYHDEHIISSLFISSSCYHLIKELRNAQKDPDNPDRLYREKDFHAIAALRYLMLHISRPRKKETRTPYEGTYKQAFDRLKMKRRKILSRYA